jgi:hypothetical protein
LEYFNSGDSFYWYDGKKLNDTFNAQVFILKDNSRSDRKKIVFKCKLPPSDVYASLNAYSKGYKSAQSYPLPSGRVTISAFHVKLTFLQMESLNINIKKSDDEYSLVGGAGGGGDNILDFSSANFLNANLFNKKSPERYLIYQDSTCRSCQLNENSLSGTITPLKDNSVLCQIKVSEIFIVLKNFCLFGIFDFKME